VVKVERAVEPQRKKNSYASISTAYLMTLSVVQSIQSKKTGITVKNKLERKW
jgi:hypothetical protein